MVPVTNPEVHSECECCQPRPASELARLRRVNKRLLANKRQLIAELKLAYSKLRAAKASLARYQAREQPAVLLWDSIRRDCAAKRAAS